MFAGEGRWRVGWYHRARCLAVPLLFARLVFGWFRLLGLLWPTDLFCLRACWLSPIAGSSRQIVGARLGRAVGRFCPVVRWSSSGAGGRLVLPARLLASPWPGDLLVPLASLLVLALADRSA